MAAKDAALVVALLAVSAVGVARLQPRLAATVHKVKQREDVYVLPPPTEFKVLDLGYDAAAIDLLWAKLLVDYGIHMSEHRDFHPDPYIDTIVFVEPTYEPIYRFADTLLCFRPLRGDEKDARKAREVLERGTRERPGDYKVWMQYGQFVAFLGPSFLHDDAEREQWQQDGARALLRAVDLGADADRALSAAAILGKSGERKATIASLQRSYAFTDDAETRRNILAKLKQLGATENRDMLDEVNAFEARWREQYPFLVRTDYLLFGPAPNAARCAGPATADDPECARDWDDALRTAAER